MRRIEEDLVKLQEDFNKLEELGRSQDLGEWNRVQYGLWLKAVNAGLFRQDDIKSFSKFAAFFYDFFQNNNRIPTVREIKAYLI